MISDADFYQRTHTTLETLEINCYVPRQRTEFAKESLYYRRSFLWNKIASYTYIYIECIAHLLDRSLVNVIVLL